MDVVAKDIVASVKNGAHALALMQHERVKKVINTSGAYYHIDDKTGRYVLLSGQLPRLAKVYWPHSDIYKQMRHLKKCPRQSGSAARQPITAKRGRGRYQGLITGTQVHKELRDFTVLDAKMFRKLYGQLHPYCARLLHVILDRQKWLPLLPEFDIYDEALHIGTSVDWVGLDRDGLLVLLEFKTGYKHYFDGEDGYMQGALGGMRNTPQNQATLQLICSAQILHRQYGVPLEQMKLYIMRVDDESLDIVPIDAAFVQRVGAVVYQGLLRYQQDKAARAAANRGKKLRAR